MLDKEQNEVIRNQIRDCVAILEESETGRSVKKQLKTFLDGRISNLDHRGWTAVNYLLNAYNKGFPGSVLEDLSE